VRGRLALVLLCGGALPGAAQMVVPCRGQRIDSIHVITVAPTVTGLRRVPLAGTLVRNTHVVTRDEIVRGFLLFEVGDRCTELRRAESERILRAQPFLADADIVVRPGNRGGVIIEARTIDDVSLIFGGSVAGSAPNVRSVKVGSSNLAGVGITTAFGWKHDAVYDDHLQGRLVDHQLFGQPYVLELSSSTHAFGRENFGQLSLPFRTDVQRFAWRGLMGESRAHTSFVARDTGRIALAFERSFAEAGGILRVGPPGKLALAGVSFTNERTRPDTSVVRITDSGFRADTAAALQSRFEESRAARVNALLGLRWLRFRRVRGFDAMRGSQDVPIGLQLGTLVGRGMKAFDANSNDVFVASDLYVGIGNSRVIYRLQAQAEARRSLDTDLWDGLIGSGRLSRHLRVSERRTRIFSVEWSGTEGVLVPHALALGSPDGGLRGYSGTEEYGGRRGIARLEERIFLGSPFDYGDAGISIFVDAGQLWPGDLPYAQRTPVRTAAGLSLLVAVPMRSTRMWRLEVAAPINPPGGESRIEVRLRLADLTSFFWREPADVHGARARAVPASVYNWP
jgi:hypothetical protein